MIEPGDIRPLSDFQRNTKASIQRLKRSGRPEVLTVNGRPAAVLQDPAAYQRLVELAERALLGQSLKAALDGIRAGKGVSLEEFDRRMASKLTSGRRRRSA